MNWHQKVLGLILSVLALPKRQFWEKRVCPKDAVDELMQNLEDSLPIGRAVMPADIAPILKFLMSDESAVLRNEKIVVDGGSTL